LINAYLLKNGYGLLKERIHGNSFISLIFLDLYQHTLKKLHTVEYPTTDIQIVINKADSITFILNDGDFMRICKIAEEKMIIGEMFEITFNPNCFYGKYLYRLEWNDGNETRVSLIFKCLIS
jgi:hypothetical protein